MSERARKRRTKEKGKGNKRAKQGRKGGSVEEEKVRTGKNGKANGKKTEEVEK